MNHKVIKGQNLFRLGLLYGTSAEAIRILNGFKDYTIYVGQNILIPDKAVAPGEITTGKGGTILTMSSLCITPSPIPQKVADALLEFHILPINKLMYETGLTVWASLKSGFRPLGYEIATGRGSGSQHTFEIENKDGTGAVDWTTDKQYLTLFEHELIERTKYKRIARYPGFFHCDYKDVDGTRRLYRSDAESNWTFIKSI